MALAMFCPGKLSFPILLLAVALCIGAAQGLRCFICGQYNEGVGSITPCINYTAHMHLKECPSQAEWCIKYVSGGSTVRDCVPMCVDKEAWSTQTFCCQEDGCNSGPALTSTSATLCAFAAILVLFGNSLRG